MRTRAKKFSVAVVALGGALALAGCGTPSSSHIVLGGSTSGVGATAPTTTAPSGTGAGRARAGTARRPPAPRGRALAPRGRALPLRLLSRGTPKRRPLLLTNRRSTRSASNSVRSGRA